MAEFAKAADITIIDNTVVHLNKDHLDADTIHQIANMDKSPATSNAVVMPDCHAGNGCCVGYTCDITQSVSPFIVGGDIGCGVSAYPLPSKIFDKEKKIRKLNEAINSLPKGMSIHEEPIIQVEQLAPFFETANENAKKFIAKYNEKFKVDISKFIPTYNSEWLMQRCKEMKVSINDVMRSLGTLGNGNHFIEIDRSDEDEYLLVVHSGSRGFGRAVYRYWSNQEAELLNDDDEHPINGNVLTDANAYLYFADMLFAQQFADVNRTAMISCILIDMNIGFDRKLMVSSVHNFIDFDDLVLRKGAVRAYKGEKCIVALNMRDGILVGEGLSNVEWNNSGPHGCGRVQSRGSLKKRDKGALAAFKKEMDNIIFDTLSYETMDERPKAYRDYSIIVKAIDGKTMTNIKHYKTVMVTKGF